MSNVIIPAEIKVSGRYKAIKYDKDLNEIFETPWGKNLITGAGLDFLLNATGAGSMYLHGVAGTGNGAPSLSDSTLQAYAGKYNACQSMVIEKNFTTAPYYVKVTTTHRYYPGAFGASAVNIAEFGMVFNTSSTPASINASTVVGSRSLAVNGAGTPAAVSVLPDEYLDQVWEWTWWIPASALANVSIAVDGVGTSTDTEARPACMGLSTAQGTPCWFYNGFTQGVEPAGGGNMYIARIFPVATMAEYPQATASTWAGTGPLGSAGSNIGGTYAANLICSAAAASSYTAGSYYRDYTFSWGLDNGNVSPSIGAVKVALNSMMWQVGYSPAIPKVVGKKLVLTFRLSIANV